MDLEDECRTRSPTHAAELGRVNAGDSGTAIKGYWSDAALSRPGHDSHASYGSVQRRTPQPRTKEQVTPERTSPMELSKTAEGA